MGLNDKELIKEVVIKKVEMYKMEVEREALLTQMEYLRNMKENVKNEYDYVQGTFDAIWGYMTPKNILIGVGVICVGITII